MHPIHSFLEVAAALERILVGPDRHSIFAAGLLVAILVVAWRYSRQPDILAVSAAPILAASLAFVTWPEPLDAYWMLTTAPSAVLCFSFALHAVWRPLARIAGAAALALVLLWLPARAAASMNEFRFPAYGPLREGVQNVARRTLAVRGIQTAFDTNLATKAPSLYGILGGEIRSDAELTAIIQPSGDVTFTTTR